MIENTSEYLGQIEDFYAHQRDVVVSWSDDGVTLMCKRESCMEEHRVIGAVRKFYWQREIEYQPYPEDLVTLRNKHLRGEW